MGPGPWIALRSRSLWPTCVLVLATTLVVVLWGERTYLLRVTSGVDARPVSLAEVATVLVACCLPAVAAPQLWSWERARPRTVLRTISGVMVPTAMVTISFAPLLAGRLDSTIGSSEARAILFSSVTFGSASLIAGIWFGRRVGSLVGVAGYLGGLVAQMLQLPLPAPYEGSDDSLLMPGISCTLLALGVVCMAATLGRASVGAASP